MSTKTSDYITVKETAAIWNVSVRYVNMCVADGRVPGTVRMGNMWLIPKSAGKPMSPRREKQSREDTLLFDLANITAETTLPMPHDNPDRILDAVNEERLRLQYEGELAYLRGDFNRTKRCYQKTEGDNAARLRASSAAIAAAISTGDYPFYINIETFLKGFINPHTKDGLSTFAELMLANAYTGTMAPNMVPNWLKVGDFSALMPQAKPDAAYKRAKYFQCLDQFESMLVTAQTALEFCGSKSGISFHDIYFLVVCAMACCALERTDEAKAYLLHALRIALPHGFITPFAESASAFGGLLEQLLKREYPEYFSVVTEGWQRTFVNWLVFHNRFTKDNITLMLSLRDYELASMIARRVPYAKIAKQFNISGGRLKNKVTEIYGKLCVSNRDELAKLIL